MVYKLQVVVYQLITFWDCLSRHLKIWNHRQSCFHLKIWNRRYNCCLKILNHCCSCFLKILNHCCSCWRIWRDCCSCYLMSDSLNCLAWCRKNGLSRIRSYSFYLDCCCCNYLSVNCCYRCCYYNSVCMLCWVYCNLEYRFFLQKCYSGLLKNCFPTCSLFRNKLFYLYYQLSCCG
jgi:hypothetical protein